MTATAKKQKPLKRHPSKLKKMSAYMILTLILISIVAVLFAFQLQAHALGQRALPFQHLPDFCQRHIQLAQKLDALQALHICLRVAAVAVARLAAGGDEPLLLVKADVFLVTPTAASTSLIFMVPASLHAHSIPSRKGKVKCF